MNLRKSALLCLLLLLWARSSFGQTSSPNTGKAAFNSVDGLGRGVVVEKFLQGYEAEQAGLREGDVLLTWSRGDTSGELESPFDFMRIDTEQGARGGVVLHGLRGTEPRAWSLGPAIWGADVRPNFNDELTAVYRDSRALVEAGKSLEVATRLRAAANQSEWAQVPWLRPWMLFHAAAVLAGGPQSGAVAELFDQLAAEAQESAPPDSMIMLLGWADVYYFKLDTENAEKRYRKAVEKAGESGLHGLELVKGLSVLGGLVGNTGDLAESELICRHAISEAGPSDYANRYVVFSLSNLGITAWRRGDLIAAESYFNRIREITEKIAPGNFTLATVFMNLGNVALDRGDLELAETYDKRALVFAEKAPPRTGYLAAVLNNLGELAEKRGNWAEAEGCLRRALELKERRTPGGLFSTSTLQNLGDVARNRNRPVEAEDWYRRALAVREKKAPGTLQLADTLQALGDLSAEAGETERAEEFFRRALAIRERIAPSSALHAETLASLAGLLRRKEQSEAATQLYDQALNALDGQTARLGGSRDLQSGFRARHAGYYREYIDLLLERKSPEIAFQVLERSRARSLLEMLAEAHSDIHTGVETALLERERLLRAEIAVRFDRRAALLTARDDARLSKVSGEISELTVQYEEMQSQIRAASPVYADLTQPQPLSAVAIQKLLAPETLLLEYSLGEKRSYVWAITAGSLNSYELPGRAEIEKQARKVYDLLTARNRGVRGESAGGREARLTRVSAAFRQAAGSLSEMVLGPVAAELKSRKLIVVSDGALQFVPFAVLPVPGSGAPGRVPLMVRHEIVSLPSASVLAELRRQAASREIFPRLVAVLADPVFTTEDTRVTSKAGSPRKEEDLSAWRDRLTRSAIDLGSGGDPKFYLHRLPYSRQEALAIRALTPPGQGLQALDFDASRRLATSGELAQYRIVHFATHGLLDSKHPELSGLVLSLVDKDGKPQNGFLDLQDIYNLKLPADLVVLSACETGLGKEIAGEGLVGLTRGFMYAGATRVVASLWSVGDNATAELMKRFYRSMLREGLTPSAALRKAQVEMWKNPRWSDAYYWGAFVVQGE